MLCCELGADLARPQLDAGAAHILHRMGSRVDPTAVRTGRVRGRYFRENFAQGGVDLVQIIPELVTNADAAISASGRRSRAHRAGVRRARSRVSGELARAVAAAALARRCGAGGTSCAAPMTARASTPSWSTSGWARWASRRRSAVSAGCSAAGCATCGSRRAADGSRGPRRAAVESWFFPGARR